MLCRFLSDSFSGFEPSGHLCTADPYYSPSHKALRQPGECHSGLVSQPRGRKQPLTRPRLPAGRPDQALASGSRSGVVSLRHWFPNLPAHSRSSLEHSGLLSLRTTDARGRIICFECGKIYNINIQFTVPTISRVRLSGFRFTCVACNHRHHLSPDLSCLPKLKLCPHQITAAPTPSHSRWLPLSHSLCLCIWTL